MNEEKPDTVIISAGTNNLTKKKQTAEETTYEIIEVVKTCHNRGVQNILVSSITCRPSHQTKVNQINDLLKNYARVYNFKLIDNANIQEKHLRNDGVHLNKEGIYFLANNFLSYLNQPIVPFYGIWD